MSGMVFSFTHPTLVLLPMCSCGVATFGLAHRDMARILGQRVSLWPNESPLRRYARGYEPGPGHATTVSCTSTCGK